MRPILILYSSREGQTRKVVGHVIEYLAVHNHEICVEDVESWLEPLNPADYRAVIVAASVHHGPHASEMVPFVRRRRFELRRVPTGLLAISLAAASTQPESQDALRHARSRAEIAKATKTFLESTGVAPRRLLPVAGSLLYTPEGRLDRFVLQQLADETSASAPTPWTRLDRFVDELLSLPPPLPARRAASVHG
jgi:menaquinone-dependent protoporphyrinogen oxidase